MPKPITPVILLLLLLNSNHLICQVISVFDAPYKYINPEPEDYKGGKSFKFSAFKIIDARPDTSKIGLYRQNINIIKTREICRLNYKNGLTADVTNFLRSYYKPEIDITGDTVVIVIKKAWISQYDTTISLGNNFIGSGRIFLTKLKMELYLKKEDYYYPITRVDTSYITTVKRSVNGFGYEITDAIINYCENLFTLNIPSILRRKKYTLSQVHQFNSKAFDHPILQTKKYKKGVYVNFSEFLNNEPSLDYISINQNKYGDVLYLNDGNGKEYASNRFWGFCDGDNLYIISGKNFFKLVRIQNTFEFYGIKNLRERIENRGDVTKKHKPVLNMCIYQVDLETGETY